MASLLRKKTVDTEWHYDPLSPEELARERDLYRQAERNFVRQYFPGAPNVDDPWARQNAWQNYMGWQSGLPPLEGGEEKPNPTWISPTTGRAVPLFLETGTGAMAPSSLRDEMFYRQIIDKVTIGSRTNWPGVIWGAVIAAVTAGAGAAAEVPAVAAGEVAAETAGEVALESGMGAVMEETVETLSPAMWEAAATEGAAMVGVEKAATIIPEVLSYGKYLSSVLPLLNGGSNEPVQAELLQNLQSAQNLDVQVEPVIELGLENPGNFPPVYSILPMGDPAPLSLNPTPLPVSSNAPDPEADSKIPLLIVAGLALILWGQK